MSYLTGTPAGSAHPGITDVRTGLGVPGLAHPLVAPGEWGELARPGRPLHWVALDVSDGPGSRPDPSCLESAGRLRNAGVRVLGRIDALYGARAFAEVISEAQRYLDWYQVDGFLLERSPADRGTLPALRRTAGALRTLHDAPHVVLDHGVHPHPGYVELADQLVTFSGPWSDYRWSQVAEWTAEHPPERFCHFVHGVPRGHLDEALRIARWQGAATIWFTDGTERGGARDPWETMPGYWDDIVSRIGTGVSE
ncbi:spherulation-specific family 4 protein [Streptomyces sp. ID05-04B]|uniref:spherulation-specific family 4 protein n=1 Tax=unclassified Streptomyces TaxID=2593676 RepID=UPI000D19DFB0|nr:MULTISPECIES: spherulation-specific family 4 protein [unclassified Streptomyces]AVV40613.1 phage tail protein [Streptomyces sp. P3]MDX5566098.1 spherulation-specific family 4 protein [Streptomyces sp. ID05-04B]